MYLALVGFVLLNLYVYAYVFISLFVLCTFSLVIVLSVLLRYMDSDYLFGLFKLFLWRCHGFTEMKGLVAQKARYLDYLTTHTSLSPIRRGFAPGF